MAETSLRRVDHTAIKVAQAVTILLLAFGFVIDSAIPVLLAAISQLASAAALPFGPYALLYRALGPSGVVRPSVHVDNPEPHRFAALVGGSMDLIGGLLLLAGSTLGWVPVAIVFVLANFNLWLGFCAGCTLYYLFNRLGVPGFVHAPVKE
ncbi:MAG: DUF4395 domain-containing protein [Anaerolineae bacterium]|nr:DUF4395 domain-containing protein [Anaerolineae bacterium]